MAMLFTIITGSLRRRGNGSPPAPYNFTCRVLGYSGYRYFYTEWFIRKPLGQEQQLLLCAASVHIRGNTIRTESTPERDMKRPLWIDIRLKLSTSTRVVI